MRKKVSFPFIRKKYKGNSYYLEDKDKLTFSGKQLREWKLKIEQLKLRRFIKILRDFKPTKSNMMYDEVLDEIERQLKRIGKENE